MPTSEQMVPQRFATVLDRLLESVDRLDLRVMGSTGLHECTVHAVDAPHTNRFEQRADEPVGAFVVRCIADASRQRDAALRSERHHTHTGVAA